MEEINNERKILSGLKHKSVVGMKAAWTDRDYFYLLLDYAVAGDLLSFLKKNGKNNSLSVLI